MPSLGFSFYKNILTKSFLKKIAIYIAGISIAIGGLSIFLGSDKELVITFSERKKNFMIHQERDGYLISYGCMIVDKNFSCGTIKTSLDFDENASTDDIINNHQKTSVISVSEEGEIDVFSVGKDAKHKWNDIDKNDKPHSDIETQNNE